ncbi:EAL domain-containing protein [Pontibacterium granulatum]|uniref:EAL domain-containing protein n=1 Tax=Pontibacterium granulatum TaxID=2036029 RepID=UPI00249B77C3|nr:EAL domain-containing protein [Pontibacterium granulatum]MDI3324507.1 EAL domain-containing protein [Pontibacterium granulatum]
MRLTATVLPPLTKNLLLALVYFLTAKLALGMAVDGYASPFWPPTGIAVAAILLGGYRLLPGVFLGAFTVNWQVDQLSLTALQIAIGNSLEAFLVGFLVSRFVSRRYFLNYYRQVIHFTVCVMAAAALGAAVGSHAVTTWQAENPFAQFLHIWNVWWLGDVVGALVFAPLILSFARRYKTPQRNWREKVLFVVLVVSVGGIVFGGWGAIELNNAPFAFLPVPLLVAVAYRFVHRGSALSVLFLALTAINGTLAGYGPFVSDDIPHSLLLQQVYVCCLALCGLLLCAVIHERERAQQALQRLSNRLEGQVKRATRELVEKNATLRQKQREQASLIVDLRTSENRYRAIFDNAPEAVVLLSLNTFRFVDANDNALSLFGYSHEQMMGLSVKDISPPYQPNDEPSAEMAKAYIERAMMGDACCFEWQHLNAKGYGVQCEVRLVQFPSREDRLVRGSITVIEERVKAEERRRLTAKLFENTSEAVIITDNAQNIIEVNDAFCRISGYSAQQVIGKPHQAFVFAPQEEELYRHVWQVVEEKGRWQGEVLGRRRNGELYPKSLTLSEVRSSDGHVTHYLGQFTDITEAKAKEERLIELATFDHLTGLYNRSAFLQNLKQAVADSSRSGREFAVLFVDLDGFKRINDSLGHDFGDQVIRIAAERLKQNTRVNDLVSRLGGDEFTLLVREPQAGIDQARLAEKVLTTLAKPYQVGDKTIHLTASIGISRYPADGGECKELLRTADLAMYRAKNSGKNNYQFYTAEMKAQVQRQLRLETELHDALLRNEFRLHYQPQIELRSGRLVGMEALIRWQHPELGLLYPGEFIDVAEQCGLICDIGNWALHEACNQARLCQRRTGQSIQVAVNLSARQFHNPRDLLDQVDNALSSSDLPASLLELEITESMLMEDVHAALGTLVALRDKGISIAIDDFGTGYSSLAYLKQFSADRLKIDQAFVRDLEHDPDDAAIICATVALAHSLKLQVIAEGVENEAQKNFLIGLGCDEMQGYLVAKPMPPDALVNFILDYHCETNEPLVYDI